MIPLNWIFLKGHNFSIIEWKIGVVFKDPDK